MKKFKRVLALLTAAVLVMSMGMGAMATEPTVNGTDYDHAYFTPAAEEVSLIGHTFNAVQIVKAEEYDATKKSYEGLSWGAQIEDQEAALLTALQADDTLKDDFKDFVCNSDFKFESNSSKALTLRRSLSTPCSPPRRTMPMSYSSTPQDVSITRSTS